MTAKPTLWSSSCRPGFGLFVLLLSLSALFFFPLNYMTMLLTKTRIF